MGVEVDGEVEGEGEEGRVGSLTGCRPSIFFWIGGLINYIDKY